MKFRIRVSKSMASYTSVLGSIEDRLIRMPLAMRDKFGLHSSFRSVGCKRNSKECL